VFLFCAAVDDVAFEVAFAPKETLLELLFCAAVDDVAFEVAFAPTVLPLAKGLLFLGVEGNSCAFTTCVLNDNNAIHPTSKIVKHPTDSRVLIFWTFIIVVVPHGDI